MAVSRCFLYLSCQVQVLPMSSIKLASGDIPGLLGYFTNNVEQLICSAMVHGYNGFCKLSISRQKAGINSEMPNRVNVK